MSKRYNNQHWSNRHNRWSCGGWVGFPLGSILRTTLAATVVLWFLNERHVLPPKISAVVSQVLFWPTLPVTYVRRIGHWITEIDDTVVMGGLPWGLAGMPDRLSRDFQVRGVINMCKEYRGPTEQYERLGIVQLHLPTVDHVEPNTDDLERAVEFLQDFRERGERVYVHCRAGHGRSGAAVFAWMLAQDPGSDPEALNQYLCSLRDVRKGLWKQTNIREFHNRLKKREASGLASDAATVDLTEEEEL